MRHTFLHLVLPYISNINIYHTYILTPTYRYLRRKWGNRLWISAQCYSILFFAPSNLLSLSRSWPPSIQFTFTYIYLCMNMHIFIHAYNLFFQTNYNSADRRLFHLWQRLLQRIYRDIQISNLKVVGTTINWLLFEYTIRKANDKVA